MLRFACLALVVTASSAALAADAAPNQAPTTLTLSAEDAASWSQVNQALDACVAGLTLRNDAAICRGLSQWLSTFAGRVAIASKSTVAAPAPPVAPAQPAPKPASAD